MNTPIGSTIKTALRLPRPLRAQLEHWAIAAHPHESCGLLLGRREGALIEAVHVRRGRNLNVSRAGDRYELDPADHLAVQEEAHARGLDVVGVWHSHPDHAARPSETDRAQAWNEWSYVIVSVSRDAVCELRSWRLHESHFIEEEVLP